MRDLYLIALSASALSAAAVTVDVPRLPAPAHANWEASADTAIPTNTTDNLRVFRLEMTFGATLSNNVQVAFGRDDLPADGFLETEETALIVGWDRGEWFLRPRGLRERYTFPSAVTNGTRTLTADIRVSPQGAPRSVTFKDDEGVFTFDGLTLTAADDWLSPGQWTNLRVTARGATETNEIVSAKFMPDGARIIIR